MREAITTLNQSFGCRIFVIALADRRRVFDGGKVGTWAATLDELARSSTSSSSSRPETATPAAAIASNRR